MRIKLQHGHVMFDVDRSEVGLLADGRERAVKREAKCTSPVPRNCLSGFPGLVVAVVENETSYVEEINQRANKQTHMMEEILSHHCWHPCQAATSDEFAGGRGAEKTRRSPMLRNLI